MEKEVQEKYAVLDANAVFIMAEIHFNKYGLSKHELRKTYGEAYDLYLRIKHGEEEWHLPETTQKEISGHTEFFRLSAMTLAELGAHLDPYPIDAFIRCVDVKGIKDEPVFIGKSRDKALRALENQLEKGAITEKSFKKCRERTIKKFDDIVDAYNRKDWKTLWDIDSQFAAKMKRRHNEILDYQEIVYPYLERQMVNRTDVVENAWEINRDVSTALCAFSVLAVPGGQPMMELKDVFDGKELSDPAVLYTDKDVTFYTFNSHDFSRVSIGANKLRNKRFIDFVNSRKDGEKAYEEIIDKLFDIRQLDLSTRMSGLQSLYFTLGISEAGDGIPVLHTRKNGHNQHFYPSREYKSWDAESRAEDPIVRQEVTENFLTNMTNDNARRKLSIRLSRMLYLLNLKDGLREHFASVGTSLEMFKNSHQQLGAPHVHVLEVTPEMKELSKGKDKYRNIKK